MTMKYGHGRKRRKVVQYNSVSIESNEYDRRGKNYCFVLKGNTEKMQVKETQCKFMPPCYLGETTANTLCYLINVLCLC